MSTFKKLLAVSLTLMMILCCIPLSVSAEIQIPQMNNANPVIVYAAEGTVIERTYANGASTLDWANGWGGIFIAGVNGPSDNPTPVDATSAETLEFDIYSSANLNNGFSVWLSSAIGEDPGRYSYPMSALKSGWTHYSIPLTNHNNHYGTLDVASIKSLILESTINIADEGVESANIIIANLAFTKSSPDINNTYTAVYESAGTFIERNYNDGDFTVNWETGWTGIMLGGFGGSSTSPTPVNAAAAEYLEFDFYSSSDLNNDFHVWLSSATGADPGRKTKVISGIKKGWNHFCLPLGEFGGAYGEMDITALKTLYFHTTIDIADETASSVNLKVSNVCFTKSYPDIDDRLIFGEPIFENSNILFNKTVANGTFWESLGMAMNIANGEAVDTTTAKYLEFDVYSSTDLASGGAFWITSSFFTNSGRRALSLPKLSAGWNHLYYDLDSFVFHTNGEWAEHFDRAAVKGIFFELTPSAVDASVENINLKVANVAFTKDVTSNNVHTTVDSVEGTVFVTEIGSGANLHPNNSFVLADPLNTIDATYIELDIYATKATDSEFLMWVADNREASTLRAAYIIPVLEEGWNHVCIDVINYSNLRDDFEIGWGYELFQMYNFSHPFLEGIPYAEGNSGKLIFANLSVTKDSDVVLGDANGDKAVDMLDLIALKDALLETEVAYNEALDLDGDKEITALDYAVLKKELFAKF